MRIDIYRYSDDNESTLGLVYLNQAFFCYSLEDTGRAQKVKGKTAIPAGEYPVAFREVMSPLTAKYRQHYEWFLYHLELQGVENFDNVYIHIGNHESDTEGCILLGYGVTQYPKRMITNSTEAYKDFYSEVKSAAEKSNLTIKISSK